MSLHNLKVHRFLILVDVGVGVEGILRQSADVEDVERRVRDFEQGG